MKFNKYFFENFSTDTPFDMKNPRYVLSLDGVDKILENCEWECTNCGETIESDEDDNDGIIEG